MRQTDQVQADTDQLALQRDPGEVARARRVVGQFLAGCPAEVVTIAQLLTSEVVSNAVEHGEGDITLRMDSRGGVLKVEVTDGSPHPPLARRPTVDDSRGRGLLVVERLAASWGVSPSTAGPGKTVWFTLRTR